MPPESPPESSSYSGKDILYREGAVGFFDVQRAADALLRQGRKPSVGAIREHLGGGSPNTITPFLAKYWQKLGERLAEGPAALEQVPEALARVTELMWRRALEEARERLKTLQSPGPDQTGAEELQEQIGSLSVALAEARAREGEQLTQLTAFAKERQAWRTERASLLALLKSTQSLLQQSQSRVEALQREQTQARPVAERPIPRSSAKKAVRSRRQTDLSKRARRVKKRRAKGK